MRSKFFAVTAAIMLSTASASSAQSLAPESTTAEEIELAAEILAPFVTENEDGTITILAPDDVLQSIDPEALAALELEVAALNEFVASGEDEVGPRGAIDKVKDFVKKSWGKIKAGAKKSGKWSWWKGTQCAAGATKALASNPFLVTSNPRAALVKAIAGCVKEL